MSFGRVSTVEISFMVDKINEILKEDFTLFTFDELSNDPSKLLNLFNRILAYLSPMNDVDMSKEPPEQTFLRCREFLLTVLGIKSLREIDHSEFQHGLLNGDKNFLYSVMHHILSKVNELKVRVYLAKYLVPIKVPEEIKNYEDVKEVYSQYQQLLEEFRLIHQTTTSLKASVQSPSEIKEDIEKKEKEKDQLKSKIEEQRKKITSSSQGNWENLVQASKLLRKEQDEEGKLQDSHTDQTQLLDHHEKRIIHLKSRIAELEDDLSGEDIQEILRYSSEKNIEMSQDIDGEIHSLQAEVKGLQDTLALMKNQPKKEKEDSRLATVKRQATIVKNKKKELERKLESAKKDYNVSIERRKGLEEEIKKFGKIEIPTEKEFQECQKDLQNKANKARIEKAEITSVKSEITVLRRTVEILKNRHEITQQMMDQLEKQQGVTGFRKVQKDLEDISMKKSAVDEKKRVTLEEISKMVTELNKKISERREILGPIVEKLRKARKDCQELEQDYSEKKAAYDNIKVANDGENDKLLGEIETYEREIQQYESMYHKFHCELAVTEVSLRRAKDEKEYKSGNGKLNEMYQTYQDMLVATVHHSENHNKDLMQKQKHLSENHEQNISQIQIFANLKKLLECKIHIYRNPEKHSQFSNPNEDTYTDGSAEVLVLANN